MIGKKTRYEKTQQATRKPPGHSKTAHIPSTGKKLQENRHPGSGKQLY